MPQERKRDLVVQRKVALEEVNSNHLENNRTKVILLTTLILLDGEPETLTVNIGNK